MGIAFYFVGQQKKINFVPAIISSTYENKDLRSPRH